MVQAVPPQPSRAAPCLVAGADRNVVGALHDHHDQPAPRFPPFLMGYLSADDVGPAYLFRIAGIVLCRIDSGFLLHHGDRRSAARAIAFGGQQPAGIDAGNQ